MVITIIDRPVIYMMAARTGCINLLKEGEYENTITAVSRGEMIPNLIIQNILFKSGSKSASRNAKIPKKKIESTRENLMGIREWVK
jgi:hypothetical protein